MDIFSKCSFRSSDGYQVGICSLDPECPSSIQTLPNDKLPKSINFLFNTDFSNTVILATNEQGKMIIAIMGVVDKNNEKYVNVVIQDPPNTDSILKFFFYFIHHYQDCIENLIDCFEKRESNEEIGYIINRNKLMTINDKAKDTPVPHTRESLPPNTIFAFITEHQYSDYELRLNTVFKVLDKKRCLYQKVLPTKEDVDCQAICPLLSNPSQPLQTQKVNRNEPELIKTFIWSILKRGK